MNSKQPAWSQSSEISYKPSVIGWLCCCIDGIETDGFGECFVPLAIFGDRFTALLYAYSMSVTQSESSSRKPCGILIEDGTSGYEEPQYRSASGNFGMTREENADVARLEANARKIEFHYEGLVATDFGYRFSCDYVHIFVFPLQISNPPTDTVAPHVKLTFSSFWRNESIGSPFQRMRINSDIEDSALKRGWIVINKCEGSIERPRGKLPVKNSQLVCESEVQYFPFGIPLVSFTGILKKLSTCISEMYPAVSCINQLSNDLIGLVASFLPFNFLVQFLELPWEPRLADSEDDLKQLIRFWFPKGAAARLSSCDVPQSLICKLSSSCKATPDLWKEIVQSDFEQFIAHETIVEPLDLKYTVNEIPENANWSSLRIVVGDLPDDLAVQRVIGFLRNKIPSKYLSDGLSYVVQLLVISKADDSKDEKYRDGNWYITETLKLEFYEVNGVKHCDWFLFASQELNVRSDYPSELILHIEENSTIVYLEKSRSNSDGEWDTADVVVKNLATYLLTDYDQHIGISCDQIASEMMPVSSSGAPLSMAGVPANQLRTNHFKNMELLLNEILNDVSYGTLQMWSKISTLFQISNFSFINHQDQTTPVHSPTDLVVLADSISGKRVDDPRSSPLDNAHNSALATAYRNNSSCLKTLRSFSVNVVVLDFVKSANISSRQVKFISRHRLEMSIDKMCEIKELEFKPVSYSRDLGALLFDIFASLRHRRLQVECWDQ